MKSLLKPFLQPVFVRLRRYRKAQQIHQKRQALRQQIQALRSRQQPILLVVGSGATHFDGWISTDLPYLNVLNAKHWEYLFSPASIDRVLAEHVFEHLTIEQLGTFLRLVRPYLAPGARIRIAVPDGNHPDPVYIDQVRPGGSGPGSDDHKVLYTYDVITQVIEKARFVHRGLEYFDRQGNFHQIEWDPADGIVRRCAAHDRRNQEKPLSYTSLIVDLWPDASQ